MRLPYERLEGLDRDRLLRAVEPVLRAHGVQAVELVWRTDAGGRLLCLTIERPESREPGAGITVDLCSEISRDLSAAFEVGEVIPVGYRLEVGSPGLDRKLYDAPDYARFAGKSAKLKLSEPLAGEYVVRGVLGGIDDAGRVLFDGGRGEVAIEQARIREASLLYDWSPPSGGQEGRAANRARKAAERKAPAPGR